MEKEWYMTEDSKKIDGPLTAYEMGMKAVQKKLHSDVLVWKEGMADWTKFDDCTVLFTNNYFLDGMRNHQMMNNTENTLRAKEEKKEKKEKKAKKKKKKDRNEKKDKKDKKRKKKDKKMKKDHKSESKSQSKSKSIKPKKSKKDEKEEKKEAEVKGNSPTPEKIEEESEEQEDKSPVSRKDLKKITKEATKEETKGKRLTTEELVDIKLNKKIKKEANEILKNKDLGLDAKAKLEKEKKRKKNKKQKERKKKKWYKARMNTSVYIQGLPKDVKKEEIKEMFSRCGVIRLDPVTSEDRIKIYQDEEGQVKGDGLVTFVNLESVDLALDIMDGREIRKGFPVSVKIAEFKQKGEYRERKVVKIDEIAKIKYKGEKCIFFCFIRSTQLPIYKTVFFIIITKDI